MSDKPILRISGLILSALFCPLYAEVFFEVYGGGVGGFEKSPDLFLFSKKTHHISKLSTIDHNRFCPRLGARALGGARLGTWFASKADDACSALENLGFYIDANYHSFNHQEGTAKIVYKDNSVIPAETAVARVCTDYCQQGITTVGFMFAYRYLFSDSSLSCIEPYLALGPAVMVLRKSNFTIAPHQADNGYFTIMQTHTSNFSLKSKAVPGLELDTGFHISLSKHLYLDPFFKYRFAQAERSHKVQRKHERSSYNLFSGQLGIGYDF